MDKIFVEWLVFIEALFSLLNFKPDDRFFFLQHASGFIEN